MMCIELCVLLHACIIVLCTVFYSFFFYNLLQPFFQSVSCLNIFVCRFSPTFQLTEVSSTWYRFLSFCISHESPCTATGYMQSIYSPQAFFKKITFCLKIHLLLPHTNKDRLSFGRMMIVGYSLKSITHIMGLKSSIIFLNMNTYIHVQNVTSK